MITAPCSRWRPLSGLPHALGIPPAEGLIRSCPEDFQVEEMLGFAPDGCGEHVLLQVRKRNTNTDWVARQLASRAGVPVADVSYAGLKDRYALTTQWFSVRLAGRREPDWQALENDDVHILQMGRHGRKLRRGAFHRNRFRIRIRGLRGRLDSLASRLEWIRAWGTPNYFGEQRFGHDYGNLHKAEELFSGGMKRLSRHRRGLYLSAVRSQLFNEVLGLRIESGNWTLPLAGDVLLREDDGRVVRIDEVSEAIRRDSQLLRAHATGPLWGRGELLTGATVRVLEEGALERFGFWREGLEAAGLKQARRALRAVVQDLNWEWGAGDCLELAFELSPGSYATMVMRELVRIQPASTSNAK